MDNFARSLAWKGRRLSPGFRSQEDDIDPPIPPGSDAYVEGL